jgi:hypothetical protein
VLSWRSTPNTVVIVNAYGETFGTSCECTQKVKKTVPPVRDIEESGKINGDVWSPMRTQASLLSGKVPPVPIEVEIGWNPEAVWTFWWGEISLLPLQETEKRFHSLSACRLVNVSTDVLKSRYSEHITNGCVIPASVFFGVSFWLQTLNCTSEETVLDTNGTRVKTKEMFVGTFCMHRSTWIAL